MIEWTLNIIDLLIINLWNLSVRIFNYLVLMIDIQFFINQTRLAGSWNLMVCVNTFIQVLMHILFLFECTYSATILALICTIVLKSH